VFFFADPYKNGMSGDFARLLTRTIPKKIREISMACFGSAIMESFGRVFDYVLHQRNPLLIIAYLIVINSAFLGWLLYGEPQLPTKLASNIHSYIGFIGVVACQISFYLACTMSPGVITSQNVEKFNHVPFDGILYVSEKVCTTCRIPKVARSKHCNLCGFCVPIFDHHCIWLNQCVGELNHKYFLLFLIINSAFFIYATIVISLVLVSEVYEKDLMNATFYNHITGEEFKADWLIVFQYVITRQSVLFAVWLIAVVMGIAVTAFLGYHLYLLWAGTTTNETFKWDYVKKVHKELTRSYMAFKAAQRYGGIPSQRKSKRRSNGKEQTIQLTDCTSSATIDINNSAVMDDGKQNENATNEPTILNKALSTKEVVDSEFVGCVPVGFKFNEPIGYKKQFIRSIMDKIDEEEEDDLPEYLEEDPGPLPKNIYKIGLLKTLWRVFFITANSRDEQIHKKTL
jgi:palmitoyltransferase